MLRTLMSSAASVMTGKRPSCAAGLSPKGEAPYRQIPGLSHCSWSGAMGTWAHKPGVSVAAELHTLTLPGKPCVVSLKLRSEEHTSELQSLMRHSYAVLCLTKKI